MTVCEFCLDFEVISKVFDCKNSSRTRTRWIFPDVPLLREAQWDLLWMEIENLNGYGCY